MLGSETGGQDQRNVPERAFNLFSQSFEILFVFIILALVLASLGVWGSSTFSLIVAPIIGAVLAVFVVNSR